MVGPALQLPKDRPSGSSGGQRGWQTDALFFRKRTIGHRTRRRRAVIAAFVIPVDFDRYESTRIEKHTEVHGRETILAIPASVFVPQSAPYSGHRLHRTRSQFSVHGRPP